MSSITEIATVKFAVEICNSIELRREILCVSGDVNEICHPCDLKEKQGEIIEHKAVMLLRNRGLPENILENVMSLVLPIGKNMFTWAVYHEKLLGISREYSFSFLNSSFFTSRGTIDNKKTAEELIRDKSFNIKQRFTLACLHCFEEDISGLYSQMTNEDKKEFYDAERPERIRQPGIVKFWTYYLMGDIEKLKGEKDLDHYRLEKAIEVGSKTAVEYSLEKTNLSRRNDALVEAAALAVRKKTESVIIWKGLRNRVPRDGKAVCAPSDYYMDIMSFLLSKMREDQQIDFLRKDIETIYPYTANAVFEINNRSRVLESFLSWPYQVYFTKMANLMWEFLPESNYAVLLLKICDKIQPEKDYLKYGDEKSYNYRMLLKEFWCQSPERYKNFVFTNEQLPYGGNWGTKIGVTLLTKLLTLKNFTSEDATNVQLILASATDEYKEIIISSEKWKGIFIELIKREKWELFDWFVSFFLSKEEAVEFKRSLSCEKLTQMICIDFLKNDKRTAADLFIKWSNLSEEKINKLKKEMIYSGYGKCACADLISGGDRMKAIDKFASWYLPYEEVKAFKRELILSDEGSCKCADLVKTAQSALLNEFINYSLSSEEEITEFKRNLAYWRNCSVCHELISDFSNKFVKRLSGNNLSKWEQIDKFLSWSFSSEKEVSEFKKRFLEVSGKETHRNLILTCEWKEAEALFAWLELTSEEIKKIKKETLFNYAVFEVAELVYEALLNKFRSCYRSACDNFDSQFVTKEPLIRWFLTDKETVLEFQDYWHLCNGEEVGRPINREEFDLVIARYLSELDEEENRIKGESEALTPNTCVCASTIEIEN